MNKRCISTFLALFGLGLAACAAAAGCASVQDRERAAAAYARHEPARPFPESRFIEADGFRLHFRHWLPSRPARGRILLIHGFGASTYSFRHQVDSLLEAGWELAAVDHPPFGFSGKPLDYAAFDRGRLLWAVPESLGWNEPIVLLGHSLGGQYACDMALREPGRVRALVLLAPAIRGASEQPGAPGLFQGSDPALLGELVRNWGFVRDCLVYIAAMPVPDEMVDGYCAPFQAPGGIASLKAWAPAMASQPVLRPERLACPALLVWGDRDPLVPIAAGRSLAGLIKDARLVVLPGRGHLPHETEPDLVNAPITAFLAGLEP